MKKINIFLIGLIIFCLAVIAVEAFPLLNINTNSSSGTMADSGSCSVVVGGDVMLGRKTAGVISESNQPFADINDIVSKSDIFLFNLESPLTTSSDNHKKDVPLKGNPDLAKYINVNQNTVAALANNHAFDYGQQGMDDTINTLNNLGIKHTGAGHNIEEATEPVTINTGNRTVTIINCMDQENFDEYGQDQIPQATSNGSGFAPVDFDRTNQQIKDAKTNSDIVIAYLHYGNEYSTSPNARQKEISHTLIDQGADVVIGSHQHVAQGFEVYNDKPIFYGLGNFVFDQSNVATHSSLMLKLDFVDNHCKITIYPLTLVNYLPQQMGVSDGKSFLNSLNPQSDQVKIQDDGTGIIEYNLTNNKTN
ncbi:MAG: CapA family protein [Methanobacteriaceae archaeon]|nr:CapA family protein [Methanobacteriaceae archaeon]